MCQYVGLDVSLKEVSIADQIVGGSAQQSQRLQESGCSCGAQNRCDPSRHLARRNRVQMYKGTCNLRNRYPPEERGGFGVLRDGGRSISPKAVGAVHKSQPRE